MEAIKDVLRAEDTLRRLVDSDPAGATSRVDRPPLSQALAEIRDTTSPIEVLCAGDLGTRLFREWRNTHFGKRERGAVWARCGYPDVLLKWAAACDDSPCGFVLAGPPGTGKTMTLVLAAFILSLSGRSFSMWSAPRLSQFVRDPDRSLSEMRRLKECEFLLLDDLGREYATDWSSSQFDQIILERHSENRPVILTTNVGYNDMLDFGWARMAWRVRDMACEWVEGR